MLAEALVLAEREAKSYTHYPQATSGLVTLTVHAEVLDSDGVHIRGERQLRGLMRAMHFLACPTSGTTINAACICDCSRKQIMYGGVLEYAMMPERRKGMYRPRPCKREETDVEAGAKVCNRLNLRRPSRYQQSFAASLREHYLPRRSCSLCSPTHPGIDQPQDAKGLGRARLREPAAGLA
jgi:hypothetical protein